MRCDVNELFYKKLDVYHNSKKIVADVYALTKQFPSSEQFGLTNQLQRAAISVPSNIAEGMGRFSVKERMHFLEIASGSLMETMCQLEIAQMLGYVSQSDLNSMEQLIQDTLKMIVGLRNSMNKESNV